MQADSLISPDTILRRDNASYGPLYKWRYHILLPFGQESRSKGDLRLHRMPVMSLFFGDLTTLVDIDLQRLDPIREGWVLRWITRRCRTVTTRHLLLGEQWSSLRP